MNSDLRGGAATALPADRVVPLNTDPPRANLTNGYKPAFIALGLDSIENSGRNRNLICPERQRLLVVYGDTVRTYYEAARTLVETLNVAMGADVDLLRRTCRRAWEQAEQARIALNRHEANHFCDRFTSTQA